MAGLIVRGISDRYWTEHTGVRTGDDGMSHFWDEKNEGSAELDELFDGGAASEAQLTQNCTCTVNRSEGTHSLRLLTLTWASRSFTCSSFSLIS